ncbi:iron-containing alcohol dehydrogenase [Enterococcus avium]|uniref:iron-containing alcohol dehydrogenase n=1 Tax=Enterococcus avium TaxID=33945 RepID=UPI0025B02271|nr:iron-containing alcohol dehydrogenase [Enterococcus avium]MDN2639832.1 iron-containing alcohol dehydrogenase [Enterococcus avium]
MTNSFGIFNFGSIKTIEGRGALSVLGSEIVALGYSSALIVTDSGVEAAGHVEAARKFLESKNIEVTVYAGVQTDPLDVMVDEGLQLLKQEKSEVVIGLGGGSSLDVAKCISTMETNEGHIMDYTRASKNPRKFLNNRIPLVLIPTTSGTGSELSPFAVITNTKINRKSNVTSQFFLPDVVILDGELSMTLPADWTACTGMDAITHAIEGLTIKDSILYGNKFVEVSACEAIRLISSNLREAYAIGNNYEARKNVMLGSHLSGGILAAGTGASHGLANMLSKYYHVRHGDSVGMLLPYCMQYNLIACPERFAKIAELMGENIEGLSAIEAGQKAVDAVKKLINDINLPKLSDYIKDEKEIYEFLEESLNNSCNFSNARDITKEAAEEIYLSAFKGS